MIPSGTLGIGGLSYLLRCINTTPPEDSSQWQWLLGRLYVLDRFIEEYPDEFVIVSHLDDSGDTTDKRHYNRVMSILIFIKPFLQHGHTKVARMARRVFYVLSKMQVHDMVVFREIIDLLSDLQTMIQVHMKRKLLCIAEENYRIQQVHLEDGGQTSEISDEQMFLTPSTSTCSTPRSTSPVSLSPQPSLSVPKSSNQSVMPVVPPNSPSRKMKTKLRRWRVSSPLESLSTNTARDRVSGVRHRSPPLYRSRRPVSTESIDLTDGVDDSHSASGFSGNNSELKLPPSDNDRNNVDSSNGNIPEHGVMPKSEQNAIDANVSHQTGERVSSTDNDEEGACSLPVVPSTNQPTRPVDFGSEFSFGEACSQDRQAGDDLFKYFVFSRIYLKVQ